MIFQAMVVNNDNYVHHINIFNIKNSAHLSHGSFKSCLLWTANTFLNIRSLYWRFLCFLWGRNHNEIFFTCSSWL